VAPATTSRPPADGDGRASLQRRPLALVGVPVVQVGAVVVVAGLKAADQLGSAEWMKRAQLVLVFSAKRWHYIKQACGVAIELAGRTRAGARLTEARARVPV